MATTSKPTGLTLSRNGNNFTLSWKKGDNNYDAGQNFEWRTNNDAKFIANSIAKRDTSKVKQLSESDYYPNTELFLEWIEMRVRGKRAKYKKKGKTIKPTMSAWATKRLDLAPPKKPQLTATMHESQWNVCTFAWEVETSDTDIYWFNDVEWETILVKESDVTNGADLAWETDETYQYGTGTKTDNQVITEDSFDISDGSYTRWFRVRSRGPAGASGWEYQNHVYGLSYQAIIESAVATVQPAGGFQCRVVWEAPANPSHPIDKTTVEYSITVPDADLACPDDASWTSANVSADTENKDAVAFPIDRLLSNDQCLFVRVNTEHDGVNTYGVPRLVDGGVGALSNPTLNSVTLGDNYMVTINATNASTVEDSYLVILYRPASDPTGEIVLGTIPHGQTSKSVQAPDWSGETAYAFGVYAAVGDSETISHDGALMKSSIVWGTGNVPKAPENVRVSATNISGTIRVEWDWTWTEADGAELSWADHEDAWESTDEPERYELSNIRNSRWNISGLETGVKWYIKVRLKKGTGENETYGAYSETQVIDLTSAPSIPTLVLSEPVITETGSVIASWVYTTTDGTAQTYAEICEAELTTDGIEYGDIIAHTETAQHVTINAEDAGWQTGETYYLCVRVVSASGRVSDDWSAPVPIAIAEPLEVNITETSLVEETDETNPRTFSGNPISFETEMEEEFAELKVELDPIQDLNGYDAPWVGGAGKNKLPVSCESTVKNGVTYTVYKNSSGAVIRIHAQGTATAAHAFGVVDGVSAQNPFTLKAGSYWFKGLSDGYGGVYDMNLRKLGEVTDITQRTSKVALTLSEDTQFRNCYLYVYNGKTINTDIYPMIWLQSESDDFEPYSNICPISGHDEVVVSVAGDNLFKASNYLMGIGRSGQLYANGYSGQTAVMDGNDAKITVPPNLYGFYVYLGYYEQGDTLTITYSNIVGATGTEVKINRSDTNDLSLTTPTARTAVQEGVNSGDVFNVTATGHYWLSLYHASTTNYVVSDLAAYKNSSTHTATLPQTVYGSTLDLVSGRLVVTHGYSDLSLLEYTYQTSYSRFTSPTLKGIIVSATSDNGDSNVDAICSVYGRAGSYVRTANSQYNQMFAIGDDGTIAIRDETYNTVASLKSALSGQSLCYKLATPLTYQLTPKQIQTLLGTNNVWGNGSLNVRIAEDARSIYALKEMPLTLTVDKGNITAVIERATSYHIDRPNETAFDGFEGETIAIKKGNVESFDIEDLIGSLDDGASYRLIVTVKDELGQSAEDSIDFEVHWTHQALVPEGQVVIDSEEYIAKITPQAPQGAVSTDRCDIYRLSSDRPELIVKDGIFGETYVDPYPAIGQFGGYRLVFRTANGDYITEDNEIAWLDIDESLGIEYTIIDFDGGQIFLQYNVDVSNTWAKDFQETKYLGGSVQGDWNPAVSRTSSISAVTITITDEDQIEMIHRLAVTPSLCHVRTTGGASFSADVQVTENYTHEKRGKIASYTFTITRVDTEHLDGMTLAQWEDLQEEDELE